MRWWLCSIAFLASVSQDATLVRAAPELAFPINSQVPPVAFVSQAYSFTFSPSTFTSDKPEISYSLGNAPAWLSLDSNGRTLQGTPDPADLGAAKFELNAQDEDGQTQSSVTLAVAERPNIQVGQSIFSFLRSAGPVSAPATLLLKPLQAFQLSLSGGAFTGTTSNTTYYAISSNNSPLPPWIQFDPTTLTFSGSSPPLVSPRATQQTYGVHLVATDVVGFSETVISFQIAVSYHILAFQDAVETMALAPGERFITQSFRSSLTLDGEAIEDVSIASVTADIPSWLTLDSNAISLSGTLPEGVQSQIVNIRVEDTFGDVVALSIEFQNNGSSSRDTSRSFDLTTIAGHYFSYSFDEFLLGSTDNVSADLGNASNWLEYSIQNSTLYGLVPPTLQNQTINVSITAEDDAGILIAQVKLHVRSSRPQEPTMSSSLPHSGASSPATKATTNSNGMTQLPVGTHTSTGHIIKIVLIPVLMSLAVIASIIICVCCRRKRKKHSGVEAQKELSARASFQTEAVPGTADLPPVTEGPRISNDSTRQLTPVQVPQIDLPWAPDSLPKQKYRLSKRLRRKNQASIDSGWGDLLVPPVSQEDVSPVQETPGSTPLPSEVLAVPPPIPSYSAKRPLQSGKRLSMQKFTKSERGSKVLSTISNRVAGLPNRLSGAGHGSGVLVPESMASMANRSSWQTTLASIPQGDTRPSMATLEALPPPPTDDKENEGLGIMGSAMKPSMRLVDPSSEPSESIEMQRQRFYTDRARDRLEGAARFSNAGSSRTPSLSKMPNAIRSPGRTISPPIPENATISSRLSRPSWSRWSGVGPAARTESVLDVRVPAPLFAQQSSRPARDVSMASSGQFDSALSSDSHWEDENLIAEVNDAGERHWLSDGDSAAASPRLPFEPFSSSQEEVRQANQVGLSRGAKLIDKRKHISVEDENLRRSEQSQAGSFRFV